MNTIEPTIKPFLNKVISDITITDNRLIIKFFDKTGLRVWDSGLYCCEHRFMSCDDDFKSFIGSKFVGVEEKRVDSEENENSEYHDIQFVDIQTDKGVFQLVNHNEHNGYYGGFSLYVDSF